DPFNRQELEVLGVGEQAQGSQKYRESHLVSRLSGFLVQILDFDPGSRLKNSQRRPYRVLVYPKNQSFLLPVVAPVAYGEEMLSGLAQQKRRRNHDGQRKPAINLLAIFEQIDSIERDPDSGFLRVKGKETTV